MSVATQRQEQEEELERYAHWILPGHIESRVSVVLTSKIQTAAVTRLSQDLLEEQGVPADEAAALCRTRDAEYLILVTTDPVPEEEIPDGLSQAEATKQYRLGLVFHELLHILKTAVGECSSVFDSCDDQFYETLNELFNIVEDGAIETEVATSYDWSGDIVNRLEFINQVLYTPVEDLEEEPRSVSFIGAIEQVLFDEMVWDTGQSAALQAADDDRVMFNTDHEKEAFHQTLDNLYGFIVAIFQLRSDDVDGLYQNDKTASLQRAKCLREFWETQIAPRFETADDDTPDPSGCRDGEEQTTGFATPESSESSGQAATSTGADDNTNATEGDATGNSSEGGQPDTTPEDQSKEGDESEDGYEIGGGNSADGGGMETQEESAGHSNLPPSALESDFDSPRQSVLEYPEFGDSPSADNVDVPEEVQESLHPVSEHEAGDTAGNGNERHAAAGGGDQSASSGRDASSIDDLETESAGQAQLDTFLGEENADGEGKTDTTNPGVEESFQAQGKDNQNPSDSSNPDIDRQSEEPVGDDPAAQSDSPEASSEVTEFSSDDFSDPEPVEALNRERRNENSDSSQNDIPDPFYEIIEENTELSKDQVEEIFCLEGGAGNGDLSALNVPSEHQYGVASPRWSDVVDGANSVADNLEKALELDDISDTISGVSSGTFDPKLGHRLANGNTAAFERDLPGNKKPYHIIIILDRSTSMNSFKERDKIKVATEAVSQFTFAAESLGVKVTVIDFIDDSARLVKPADIPLEYAQEAILNTSTAGGTPLGDSLELARSVTNIRNERPLIIAITDDKAGDMEKLESEIKNARCSVCSLTIATDRRKGNPPDKAEHLESHYDRTRTTFDPDNVTDALDRFASQALNGL